jgi:hypothetical protein
MTEADIELVKSDIQQLSKHGLRLVKLALEEPNNANRYYRLVKGAHGYLAAVNDLYSTFSSVSDIINDPDYTKLRLSLRLQSF